MDPELVIAFGYMMSLWFFLVGVAREKYYGQMVAERVVSAEVDWMLPRVRGVVFRSYQLQKWSVIGAVVLTLGLMLDNSPIVEPAIWLDIGAVVAYRILATRRN